MAEIEEKVDDNVEVVTDDGTVVKIVEAKEGIMTKLGKHKKLIIGAAIAGGAFVAAKIVKMVRIKAIEDSEFDADFEYDEFDDSGSDDDTTDTDDAE